VAISNSGCTCDGQRSLLVVRFVGPTVPRRNQSNLRSSSRCALRKEPRFQAIKRELKFPN
jgi:hypothetical protein